MNRRTDPQGLAFLKMHGLGNDFVILDSRGRSAVTTPDLAAQIGDRHFGVGFDQLAEIRDHPGDAADITLDFWNNDGTRAGACGNATRCVASLIMSERGQQTLRLATSHGVLEAQMLADGQVRVNMGPALRTAADIPLRPGTDPDHLPLAGDPIAIGMGNPHCVFFVEDADAIDLSVIGPEIEHNSLFPERTNVEFVSRRPDGALRFRVWERGAGITLACGSGACAAAVAAQARDLVSGAVLMHLDGGILEIDPQPEGVWMTGPVSKVFSGWLDPEMLGVSR
ncbi:MAG: diaminopimelate epimerase [Pseudomonadota bacterium]